MSLKYVVMVTLTRGEMSGYDIKKRFDERLSFVWHATHQQVYRELKQLEAQGWLSVRAVGQQDKPDKKVYRLTPQGEQELREWLAADASDPAKIKDPLLVKLFAGDYVDVMSLRAQFRTARAKYAGRLEVLKGIEEEHKDRMPHFNQADTMAFLSLRRGILAAENWVSWLDEASLLLEKFDTKEKQ